MTLTLTHLVIAGFVGFTLGCAAATAVFLCLISEVFPIEDDPR